MSGFFQFNETVERTDRPDDLHGFDVHASDGSLGKVMEFNDEPGATFLVVDTGSTVLSKKVVIPAGSIQSIDRDSKTVNVALTKDQIKAAPEFDEARYANHDYHQELSRHYTGA